MKRSLNAVLRKSRIKELIVKHETVSVPELADRFDVSEMTIRRDLAELQESGRVRRTHGGAVPAERLVFEFDFQHRRETCKAEKRVIAREAVRLIQPGQRLILDTGTTVLEVANLLVKENDLIVITPSLAVASTLQFASGIQTILLGGILRQGSPDLTGALTEHVMDMFTADVVFLGAEGIGLDGSVFNVDIQLSQMDQKMRKQATQSYVLADSSKIGRTALVRSGRLLEMSGLITDEGIDPNHRRALEELGVRLIVAPLGRSKG